MPVQARCNAPKPIPDVDLLAAVRKCIMEVMLSGQSYTFDGIQLTRADLDSLRKMETDLQNRVTQADAPTGGVRTWQVVF